MTSLRLYAALAALGLAAASLAGCAASATVDGNGPTEASVALLDEFFDHLGAAETTEAAAMTSIDFADEYLDVDFYRASVSLPSNARVIATKGSDEHTVTATVEYVLDGPDEPVTAEYTVKNFDGERLISWSSEGKMSFINVGSPGRLVLNGEKEFPIAAEAYTATLLPALYDFAYVDETGTTHLDADGTDEFALPIPYELPRGSDTLPGFDIPDKVSLNIASLSLSVFVGTDIVKPADAEIIELRDACTAELLVGPSCPPALLDVPITVADPSTIEWFGASNADWSEVTDGSVAYAKGFTLRFDGNVYPEPVVYEGHITRDDDGTVHFTRD
ncbi:hypothetical protein ACI3KS_10930 [Microbacterium sp. ZW T5_45]|uniref:hypothetical protein n=1 Tax=Microbacterium sp. ZW T5_45 TaxID=3378080 RepID=UPI00385391BC